MTTTTNIIIDFDVNEELLTEVKRAKKQGSTESKEVRLGKMVEKQFKLEKALLKKKMTFDELVTFLNKR